MSLLVFHLRHILFPTIHLRIERISDVLFLLGSFLHEFERLTLRRLHRETSRYILLSLNLLSHLLAFILLNLLHNMLLEILLFLHFLLFILNEVIVVACHFLLVDRKVHICQLIVSLQRVFITRERLFVHSILFRIGVLKNPRILTRFQVFAVEELLDGDRWLADDG